MQASFATEETRALRRTARAYSRDVETIVLTVGVTDGPSFPYRDRVGR